MSDPTAPGYAALLQALKRGVEGAAERFKTGTTPAETYELANSGELPGAPDPHNLQAVTQGTPDRYAAAYKGAETWNNRTGGLLGAPLAGAVNGLALEDILPALGIGTPEEQEAAAARKRAGMSGVINATTTPGQPGVLARALMAIDRFGGK